MESQQQDIYFDLSFDIFFYGALPTAPRPVKVGTLSVWRNTKRYPLPYIKSGRLIRYKREDVDAFIEKRKIQ